jgi:hypothetical protein
VSLRQQIKVAAVDLDDTLLGHNKRISVANQQAVQALQEAGVTVLLASGRRHENMLTFHRLLGLRDWVVSCNGALVRHGRTGEDLHCDPVASEWARTILAEGERLGVAQNVYHPDEGVWSTFHNRWVQLYEQKSGHHVAGIRPLAELATISPLKILWVDSPERIAELTATMTQTYGTSLYVTRTDPEYLEFMAPTVSKAVGVAKAAGQLGYSLKEVVAFGDGENDVPLLAAAGYSLAMPHGHASAKAAARLVAPDAPHETAFAVAVEQFLVSI